MYVDIFTLQKFYASALGQRIQKKLKADLEGKGIFAPQQTLIGLGYALPYLQKLDKRFPARHFAFMPARQGAVCWPNKEENKTILVNEDMLPLDDMSIDNFLLIHALEFSHNPRAMLEEIWRVLVPNGRVVILVPNRKGLWARSEHTPFGQGVPYSRWQIHTLLKETGFISQNITESLYFSPTTQGFLGFLSACHKRLGLTILPYFGGVLIVEAQKDVFNLIKNRKTEKQRFFMPDLTAQPVSKPSMSIKNFKFYRGQDHP